MAEAPTCGSPTMQETNENSNTYISPSSANVGSVSSSPTQSETADEGEGSSSSLSQGTAQVTSNKAKKVNRLSMLLRKRGKDDNYKKSGN